MSQYSTFAKLSLPRRIADIEKELIAIKSTQIYGATQIRYRTSSSVPIRSPNDGEFNQLRGKIRFVGVNKNKLARGGISANVVIDDSRFSDAFRVGYSVLQSTDQAPNVMEWTFMSSCGRIPVPFAPPDGRVYGTSNYTITFVINANMAGSVTYEAI